MAAEVNKPPYTDDRNIVEHVTIEPISEEIIDFQLEAYLKFIEAMMAHQNAQLMKKEGYEDRKAPNPLWVGDNVTGLFHLQVGHGIDKYRKYVISRIKADKFGEVAWRGMVSCIENTEEWKPWSGQRYPRLLAEAERVYGAGEASEVFEDKYDEGANSMLQTFLKAMIENDTFIGKNFVRGIKGYQQRLAALAKQRGGEDQNAWAEYWATKVFIDLSRLYYGLVFIEEGIEPSVADLNSAINNLSDGEIKEKWQQRAEKLIGGVFT